LLGGANIAGVLRWYSGRPFTVFSGAGTLSQVVFTPARCNGCTPDLGGMTLENGQNVFLTAEQRAKFFVPAAGEASNVGRNFFTAHRKSISISQWARYSASMKLGTWSFALRRRMPLTRHPLLCPMGT
jgi:hypothetical protein